MNKVSKLTLKKLAKDLLGQTIEPSELEEVIDAVITAKKGLEFASELIDSKKSSKLNAMSQTVKRWTSVE